MSDEDVQRLDYEQTLQQIRALTDNRFKLLALVPTLTGTAVGLLSQEPATGELLAVGSIGLVATAGVFAYELRNGEIHRAAVNRVKALEAAIGFRNVTSGEGTGGLFTEVPDEHPRLFGREVSWHGSLALVYGAALAGWSYLVVWGALIALDVPGARWISGLVGVAAGIAVALAHEPIGGRH